MLSLYLFIIIYDDFTVDILEGSQHPVHPWVPRPGSFPPKAGRLLPDSPGFA